MRKKVLAKKVLTYSLLLALTSLQSVNANELNPKKNPINLDEIILNTAQDTNIQENMFITGGACAAENSNTPQCETCIKNEKDVPQKKEIRIFSRLNPMIPVIKVNKTIECGCNCVDKSVHKGLDKTDENKFKGIKKIDKTIDSGVVHLEGAVDKGLGTLDKTFDTGLGGLDKVLNTGIEKTDVQAWLDGDYAAGRFFGERPILESHGVTINSSFLFGPSLKTSGGANGEGSSKSYGLFNLGVNVDTEKAGLWKGGTFFALYQRKTGYGLSGGNGNGAMGDYIGFDGWDWRQMNQISEYWYQQKLFDGKLRLKFGKQDANTDFGYLNSGWDFQNSAFSVIPTTPMPTYPDPSFGFMAEINPTEKISIRDGIYSRFNVPYNITEIEYKPIIKDLPGRYMIGAWELSDSNGMGVATGVDDDGETIYNNFNRNYGCYFNFEQMVYKEKKDDKNDMQGLVVFGQFGMSPSNKNDMSQYFGGGLHYKGLIPKRDKDLTGIAVGSGRFASRLSDLTYDNGGKVGNETVVEAFYRLQVSPWFYLQPDVQFIMHPGGQYDSSVAIGLRSVITF